MSTSKKSGLVRSKEASPPEGGTMGGAGGPPPSPSAAISFDGHMADARQQIEDARFSTELWVPEFGWDTHEEHAAEDPHPPQMLAAFQVFLAFFIRTVQRTWCHLAAEMQAGKTGVVTALIRLILSNISVLHIRPTHIFVITGMGDNAWKKQTRDRLPEGIRKNVHHSGGLTRVVRDLNSLAAGMELRNILIVVDESHIAAKEGNRPNLVYEEVKRLCPSSKWQENNIRFLTISATDPAKVVMVKETDTAKVVRLHSTDHYQSVRTLHAAGRIRYAEEFGHLDSEKGIAELRRCITESFSDAPRYHILRARHGKQAAIIAKLATAFPGATIQPFDSGEKLPKRAAHCDESSTSLEEIEDINELLGTPPDRHTFVVLKNMFYAAKTMNDEYVGVLYDRVGGKDDTNLQSLLGRACGYGKSSRTIVYTSKQTVEHYISCWRELCANPDFIPTLEGIPVANITKKMTGVRISKDMSGVHLHVAPGTVGPSASGGAGSPPPAAKSRHADCIVELEEFASMDLLNVRWKALSGTTRSRSTPHTDSDGFYICTIGKKSERQTASGIRGFAIGSAKGWGSGLTKADIGDLVSRVYVGYEGSVPIFFLRWTRKA